MYGYFQCVPPTTWYRFVAGWLEGFANPALRVYGVHVELVWSQATTGSYIQYGLLVHSIGEVEQVPCEDLGVPRNELLWYTS
nr:glycine-rich protein [Ipomoea batatas]GMD45964.1 glycine-rich protein [Ipomoea batatas]